MALNSGYLGYIKGYLGGLGEPASPRGDDEVLVGASPEMFVRVAPALDNRFRIPEQGIYLKS